ncbi:hypothetical protein [Derxia lacustris]|uniref:hypothetical protein n=1 Tax=Derxia lacustris TaxID=764842 RepID=UPI000A170EED|nr:hypothetical protein [Derxia lacustris]
MSDTVNVIANRPILAELRFALLEPPAWTRLEPVSVTGDPAPGLAMSTLDPLWALGRQWQFGEFAGEDAGTPLGVNVLATAQLLSGWRPGDLGANPVLDGALPLGNNQPLEPAVEAEPPAPQGPGWRLLAEAGHVLLRALAEADFDASALAASFPLPVDAPAPAGVRETEWPRPRLWRTLARGVPDAEAVAASLEAAGYGTAGPAPDPADAAAVAAAAAALPAPPDWLAAAPDAAKLAAADWLAWYRAQVAPRPAGATPSWIDERLEYRFAVRAGGEARHQVLVAPLHDGGLVDWSSFDLARGLRMPLGDAAPPDSTQAVEVDVLASPLRFGGMPSDRLWQFEDGSVNLGQLETQRHDLARLCFTEFAMVYSSDWFAVPVDVPAGSFTTVRKLSYTTTFGETIVVPPADDRTRGGRFRLFELSIAGTDATVDGLLVPPTARGTLEGRPLEDVLILRDEAANMAWAVERSVQGPSGDPRNRADEVPDAPPVPERLAGTDLQYLFASSVPHHWIPLVPVAGGAAGGFALRKGTTGDSDDSRGALLAATPFDLKDEEVVREGVRVRRVPALARGPLGERLRWIARRVSVGRGEGNSGLRFDEAEG